MGHYQVASGWAPCLTFQKPHAKRQAGMLAKSVAYVRQRGSPPPFKIQMFLEQVRTGALPLCGRPPWAYSAESDADAWMHSGIEWGG